MSIEIKAEPSESINETFHSEFVFTSIKNEPTEPTKDEPIDSEDILFVTSYKGEPIEPGQIKDEPTERYNAENTVPFLKTKELKIKLERSAKILDKLTQSVISKTSNNKNYKKAKDALSRTSNIALKPLKRSAVVLELKKKTTKLQSNYLNRLKTSLGKNFNKLNLLKNLI